MEHSLLSQSGKGKAFFHEECLYSPFGFRAGRLNVKFFTNFLAAKALTR